MVITCIANLLECEEFLARKLMGYCLEEGLVGVKRKIGRILRWVWILKFFVISTNAISKNQRQLNY